MIVVAVADAASAVVRLFVHVVHALLQAVMAYRLTREKFHELNLEEHVKFAQRKVSGSLGWATIHDS